MTYPNGRVLTSNYTVGIDSSISRLSSLSDSTGALESYTYLGLGTIVNRSMTLPGIDQTQIKLAAEAVSDSQDAYAGLDQFGRVINQRALKTSTSTNVDRFAYGYDRNSNSTYRENLLSTTNSELYAYDNLDQITSFQRGTLNAAKTGLTGAATRSQSWVLDAVGNSTSVTTNGVVQNRTTNRQNELTQVGTTNLSFDNNGDLTTDQNGKTLVYDAWNRVVEQKTGAVSNITFAYDAMNRWIKEGSTVVYFSSAWQAIEERNSSNVAQVQYTWSAAYIDAMVARNRDTDNNGSLDQRVYVMQDANWNITALANTTGAVVERFQYDAYGKRTVLSPTFVAASDTFVFNHGFAGGKADTVTGRVNFRNREYDVDLMRWTTMDPIGFAAGDMNWYQYVGAGPTGAVDPFGLDSSSSGNVLSPNPPRSSQVMDALGSGALLQVLFDSTNWGTSGSNATEFGGRYAFLDQREVGLPFYDVSNAARHGYWQVSLSARWDTAQARIVGDAHEILQNSVDSRMDLFNNNVGRDIAKELKLGSEPTGVFPKSVSLEKIRLAMDQALKQGRFVTDPADPRLNDPTDKTNRPPQKMGGGSPGSRAPNASVRPKGGNADQDCQEEPWWKKFFGPPNLVGMSS